MSKIFIGFFFVFINFNLSTKFFSFDVLPNFIGYFIMIGGFTELAKESRRFVKAKPLAIGMAVFTAILFVLNFFSPTITINSILAVVLGVLSTGVSLYLSYNIVMGVQDIERNHSVDLATTALYRNWTLLAIFSLLSYLFLLLPHFAFIGVLAGFIIGIFFLVSFYRSKRLYSLHKEMSQS